MIAILQVYGLMLLKGMGQTLLMTLLTLVIAMVIGMIFGLMNVGHNRVLNLIGTVYVDAIRGVPLIVLAYFIYFGIPAGLQGIGIQFRWDNLMPGTIALSLNCGAYMAEIIRAGIQSVDIGQMEAGRSLGLPYWKTMRKIILPQAIRTMIPSIINQFIITVKDTSILSVIGFPELVLAAKNVQAGTFKSFETWTIVGIMYLIVITILSYLAKMVERRVNRGVKR